MQSSLCMYPIYTFGSEAQKQRYLPPLAAGRERFCFAITEPDAGSNSFHIQTLARRDGDRWVLRGQKTFITGVDDAHHMLVVARTTPADRVTDKREGISLFILDTESFGLEATRIDTRLLAPERQFQVFFDDVRVPADALLGEEGRGLRTLFDALNPERIVLGAMAVGLGRFALEKAVAYASTRRVFRRADRCPPGARPSDGPREDSSRAVGADDAPCRRSLRRRWRRWYVREHG